jgi:hypothetical protein
MSDSNEKQPGPSLAAQIAMVRRVLDDNLKYTPGFLADIYNGFANRASYGLPRVDAFEGKGEARAALKRLLARLEELAAE